MCPATEEPISKIYQASLEDEMPPLTCRYPEPELKNLIRLCARLQRLNDDESFFLARRVAAELLVVPRSTVAWWFRLLMFDEVLLLIERETRQSPGEYLCFAGSVTPASKEETIAEIWRLRALMAEHSRQRKRRKGQRPD